MLSLYCFVHGLVFWMNLFYELKSHYSDAHWSGCLWKTSSGWPGTGSISWGCAVVLLIRSECSGAHWNSPCQPLFYLFTEEPLGRLGSQEDMLEGSFLNVKKEQQLMGKCGQQPCFTWPSKWHCLSPSHPCNTQQV